MKATSVLNFLTVVLFLMTGHLVWGAPIAGESKAQCKARCSSEENPRMKICNQKEKAGDFKGTDKRMPEEEFQACRRIAIEYCIPENGCEDIEAPESSKDIKKECTESIEKWKKAAKESAGACEGYEAVGRNDKEMKGEGEKLNTCANRILRCERKIGEVSRLFTSQAATDSPGQLDASGGSVDVLMQFYAQKNGIKPEVFKRDGNLINTTSCIKWSNKAIKDQRKEDKNEIQSIDEKIKAAKEKIADAQEKITKENETLRKETATLDEEKEKVQTTFKENVAKLDVKKREKYTALNKSIQDNLVKIRNLSNVIIKLKESLEKEKFDQNQRMVDFAEDKIDSQCKSAVDTARGCFAKAAKGEKTTSDKDPCSGFTSTGKGITGTSVLAKRLNDVRNACFERANLAQDKLRYDYQAKIKNIEQELIEKQNQIKDMNKNIELEKQEFDSITKENETEKTNETQSADQKQANLKEKLDKLTMSTKEKIDVAKKRIEDINLEIEALVARKLPGRLGIIPDANGNDVEVAHIEAKKLIEETEASRIRASTDCGCDSPPIDKKLQNTCTMLKRSTKDEGGGVGAVNFRKAR